MDIKTGIDYLEYEDLIKEMPISNMASELDIALRATVKASKTVLDIYRRGPKKAEKKDDGSPVTEADLASHQILTRELSQSRHPILSEEQVTTTGMYTSNTIWIVDPLDGTSHFVNKTGEFTIMVSLVKNGTPTLGVILWPLGDTVFIAQKGKGAFRYSKGGWSSITVTKTATLSECRMVGSKHHLTEKEISFVKKLDVSNFVSIGSSLKVGLISSGEAEAYVTTTDKMKVWDTAASHCIITEAGGKMTDVFGNKLVYDGDICHHYGILATNGTVHEQIVKKFTATTLSD